MKKSLKLSILMSLSAVATLGMFSHKVQAEENPSPEGTPIENVEILASETESVDTNEATIDESVAPEEALEENLSDSEVGHSSDEVMLSRVNPAYIRPVDTGAITAGWDSPWHRANGYGEHTGIDFGAAHGTPVRAVRAGVVEYEGWGKDHPRRWLGATAGIYALIRHEDGTYAGYAHLSNTIVNKGQQVRQGEIIGHVGGSGTTMNSFAPHLHFEMFPENPNFNNGRAGRMDPTQYVANAPVYVEHTPVVTTSEETKIHVIPRGEVIRVDDPTLEEGKQVYIAGHDGTRQVVERITFTDGRETKREVLSDTVISEAQADIIKTGTKVIEAVPETPIPETPKPEASPKPEVKPETPSQPNVSVPEIKPEAPKPTPQHKQLEQPKEEDKKELLPSQEQKSSEQMIVETEKSSRVMEVEKTMTMSYGDKTDDQQLPQTGEMTAFTLFSGSALTILASLGLIIKTKREDV